MLDTMAAAYASAGKFDKAVEVMQAAIQIVTEQQNEGLIEQYQNRLELYRQNQPYYDPLFSSDADITSIEG